MENIIDFANNMKKHIAKYAVRMMGSMPLQIEHVRKHVSPTHMYVFKWKRELIVYNFAFPRRVCVFMQIC